MLRRLGTVGMTFAVAFGSGFLLQHGGFDPKPKAEIPPIANATIVPLAADVPIRKPETQAGFRPLALPDLPQTATSLPQPGLGLSGRIAALDSQGMMPDGASEARYDDYGRTCPATSLSLTPAGDGSMIVLYANPCDAGAHLIVQHEGIAATLTADGKGRAMMVFPVLSSSGRVTVLSDTGEDLSVLRPIRTASAPQVVVSSDMAGALTLATGKAQPLGDADPPLAWTQPLAEGTTPLLRASVTRETCGQDLVAHVVITGGPSVRAADITVAMPDCTSVGQAVLVPLEAPSAEARAVRG